MSHHLAQSVRIIATYLLACTLIYWLRFPLMGLVFGHPEFFLSMKVLPYFVEAAILPGAFGILVAVFYLVFRRHSSWHLIPSGGAVFYLLPKAWSDELAPTFDFYLAFGLPLYFLGALIGFLILNRQRKVSNS